MKNKKSTMFLIVSGLIIIIDQIIKLLVRTGAIGSFKIIPNRLEIELIQNLNTSGNFNSIVISFIILFLILNFIKNQHAKMDKNTIISIGVIFGGIVGNLLDRIFFGHIIDYIKAFNIITFNIADVFLIIGWVLFIINIIVFSVKKNDIKKR